MTDETGAARVAIEKCVNRLIAFHCSPAECDSLRSAIVGQVETLQQRLAGVEATLAAEDKKVTRLMEIRDALQRENQELKQSNREMLEWFTKMRKAAGGHDDTMGEAVERVAGLERELAAVRAVLEKIVAYRGRVGPLGFQLEKLDDFIHQAKQALAGRSGEE